MRKIHGEINTQNQSEFNFNATLLINNLQSSLIKVQVIIHAIKNEQPVCWATARSSNMDASVDTYH